MGRVKPIKRITGIVYSHTAPHWEHL